MFLSFLAESNKMVRRYFRVTTFSRRPAEVVQLINPRLGAQMRNYGREGLPSLPHELYDGLGGKAGGISLSSWDNCIFICHKPYFLPPSLLDVDIAGWCIKVPVNRQKA